MYVFDPREAPSTETDTQPGIAQSIGGKAAGLLALEGTNVVVPRWIALTTEAFTFQCEWGISVPVRDELRQALEEALARAGLSDRPLMVRSSATLEDGAKGSLAGAFASFGGARGIDAILVDIRKCWESMRTDRARHAIASTSGVTMGATTDDSTGATSESKAGRRVDEPRMAVVIQALVIARRAGVCFSRDPSHRDFAKTRRIEGVVGFGETLVQGDVTPASALIDLDDGTCIVEAGAQDEGLFWGVTSAAERPGLVRRTISNGNADCPGSIAEGFRGLDEALAREVSHQVDALERLRGHALDVEWVEDENGAVHIVQARPVVGLPPLSVLEALRRDPDVAVWDNANVVESYSGVVAPLTFSHARMCYEKVYAQFCRLVGVPERDIASARDVLGSMIGHVRGRVYYGLLNWYRLVHLFPLAGENSSLMEEMMGVRQTLRDDERAAFDASLRARPRTGPMRKLALLLSLASKLLRPAPHLRRFERRVDALCERELRRGFAADTAGKLVDRLDALSEELLSEWSAPILNDTRCMVHHGMFTKAVRAWIPESADAARVQSLVTHAAGSAHESELASLRPLAALDALVTELRDGSIPGALWLATTEPIDAARALKRGSLPVELAPLAARLDAYLDTYGYRCPDEQKLETPDYREDPSPFFALLRARLDEPAAHRTRVHADAARMAAEAVLAGLPWHRRVALRHLARQASAAIGDRERLRLLRGKTYALPRRLFRALEARLLSVGLLSQSGDVFFLTLEEVRALVKGHLGAGAVAALIAARRNEFSHYAATPPPPERFLTRGPVAAYAAWPACLQASRVVSTLKDAQLRPGALIGLTASPGVVTAPLLVASTFEEATRVDGHILVAARTDPGWVPLFSRCKGLIIERGSALSHSAVMARELGIPTLVGVLDATTRLKSGEMATLDASGGFVELASKT